MFRTRFVCLLLCACCVLSLAGAATAVMMNTTGLITDYKTVDLDRPFVYMLVDCEQQLPFFIGCLMDPEA